MTVVAFFDCSAGAAGDMLLGALVDAGVDLHQVQQELGKLKAIQGEWELYATKVHKGPGHIAATKIVVKSVHQHEPEPFPGSPTNHQSHDEQVGPGHVQGHENEHLHHHTDTHHHDHGHDHHETLQEQTLPVHPHEHPKDHIHRNLQSIKQLVQSSELSPWVKAKSLEIFTLLAQAEAHTHGTTIDQIHFHEVGAIDSIVDTIGTVVALDVLGVRQVFCSPLPFSSGRVRCQHGVLPVPPPATFRLMIDVPVCPAPPGASGELVTPTGISIMKALAESFGEPPAFVPSHTGNGAGMKEFPQHANIARVIVGRVVQSATSTKSSVSCVVMPTTPNQYENVVVLETNIDDCNPQVIGFMYDKLLANGALDVWTQPIQMKKNRPGALLSVMCLAAEEHTLMTLLFQETTTLGIRRRDMQRVALQRKQIEMISPRFGPVHVKVGYWQGQLVNVYPEYEECRAIALAQQVPLKRVIDEIQALASSQLNAVIERP